MDERLGIVIPWQDRGDPDRRRAFGYVRGRVEDSGVGRVLIGTYPYVEGDPLIRSRLFNDGIRQSAEAGCDVTVIHSADLICHLETLPTLANVARQHRGHVWCSGGYQFLDADQSEAVYAGEDPWSHYAPTPAQGGVHVLATQSYLDVGGFDERYVGWGSEDNDFTHAVKHFVCPEVVLPCSGYMTLHHGPTGNGLEGRTGPAFQKGTEEYRLAMLNWRRAETKFKLGTDLQRWKELSAMDNEELFALDPAPWVPPDER